jgi:hypothetical protein|tara:strand:+ start:410 stop:1153 length:744 start_codon:yes stop_codon:yes gene_type:complete
MLQVSNIKIKLMDNALARKWLELYQSLDIGPDQIIHNTGISDGDFANKIKEANRLFGFDWPTNPSTQADYNMMHKDIETAPKDKADLLQSIHNDLHVKESHGSEASHIQIVWSESLGQFYKKKPISIDMPDDAESFKKSINHGDVYLGYPHVGKSPEVCMLQNDISDLPQTCRIHNKIVCDILISLSNQNCNTDDDLLSWYEVNKITMFTKEEMLKYNGWAKIGEVVNKDDLQSIDKENLKISYAND